MTTKIEAAKALLNEIAIEQIADAVALLVADGRLVWIEDPINDDVVGVVWANTNRTAVVIYLDDEDFELDESFEDSLDY